MGLEDAYRRLVTAEARISEQEAEIRRLRVERRGLVITNQIECLAEAGNPKAQEIVELSRVAVETEDLELYEATADRLLTRLHELNADLGHEWGLRPTC